METAVVKPAAIDDEMEKTLAEVACLSLPDSPHQPLTSDGTNNNNNNSNKPKSRWFYRCEQETSSSTLSGAGGESSADDGGGSSSPSTTTDFNGVAFSVGGNGSGESTNGQSPGVCQTLATSSRFELPYFERIDDNIYHTLNRKKDKKSKQPSRMICECSYEEAVKSGKGCEDECLNRLLYYECGPNCPCGSLCTNLRFQKHQCAKVEAFPAGKKGFGLIAMENLTKGTFVMEYVGEVLTAGQFRHRSKSYAKDPKHKHHYFMALKNDEVIDATRKGSISRFINHSCDPNCETQKWTVNGHLRIGFFTIKDVINGEELTFDYKFQRYGKESQKCYCGAANCRGYIDSAGEKRPEKEDQRKRDREQRNVFEDQLFDREFEDILSGGYLKNRDQVVTFGRLMLRADDFESRCRLLNLLMNTEPYILRLFIDLHGCTLLWSWMVDDIVGGAQWRQFQLLVLNILGILPIPHKDILVDSRLLPVVDRWLRTQAEDTLESARREEDSGKIVKRVICDMISSICMGTAYHVSRCDDVSSDLDYVAQIKQKCEVLLSKWSSLKENFKIPKKLEKLRSNNGSSPSDSESSKGKPVKVQEKRPNPPKVAYSLSPANRPNAYTLMNNGLKGRLINSYSTDQYRQALKRPFANAAENDAASKRIKEERRREFEAKIALEEERKLLERQRQVKEAEDEAARIAAQVLAAVSYNKSGGGGGAIATASNTSTIGTAIDDADVRRLSSMLLPPSTSFTNATASTPFLPSTATSSAFGVEPPSPFGAAATAWTTPTTSSSYDNGNVAAGVDTPETSYLQGAIPADLVHDPATAQYWWMDRSSGVFVYPATDEQIIAYQLGDISRIPHFFHDPSTDLIHEVQVRMPPPVPQAPAGQPPWVSYTDSQQRNDASLTSNGVSTMSRESTRSVQSERERRIAVLLTEIADLQNQMDCKQAELKRLVEQGSLESSSEQTSLDEQDTVPPKTAAKKLPKNWRMAHDTDGKPYYYHIKTKKTQWELPAERASDDEEDSSDVVERRRRPETHRRSWPTARKTAPSSSMAAAAKRRRQRIEELRRDKLTRKAKAAQKLKRMASRHRKIRTGFGSGLSKSVTEPFLEREDGEILPEDEEDTELEKIKENSVSLDEEVESSEPSESLEESHEDEEDEEEDEDEDEEEEEEEDVCVVSESVTSKRSHSPKLELRCAPKTTPCITTTAAADTSSEVAKKFKEAFKARISNHIIKCLNPYRKSDCKVGHITCHEDFKHLARKLTHAIMEKELKQCHVLEELKITDSVLYKAKDYIKRYMQKLGPVYKRSNVTDD